MKVKEVLNVLNTDEFFMIDNNDETYEIVRSYEKGSYRQIRKYFDKKVVNVTPSGNAVEIRFI